MRLKARLHKQAMEENWSLSGKPRRTAPTFLVLGLAGLLFGFLAYRFSESRAEESVRSRFQEHLSERAYRIQLGLLGIAEALQSLRSLFDSSENVTPEEFGRFTRQLLARHPAIQAIEWVPRVPAEVRSAYTAVVHATGAADFAITERDPDGALVPAGPRAEYFPVAFVEPRRGNERAIGFDLGSEPSRREMLGRALGAVEVVLSEPIALVQDRDPSPAFLVALEVSGRPELDPWLAPGTRGGFAVCCFRTADLVVGALKTASAPLLREVRLVDEGPAGSTTIFESRLASPSLPPWTASERMGFHGRTWILEAGPSPEFLEAHRDNSPFAIGVAVLLGWGTLAFLAYGLVRRSQNRSLQRSAQAIRCVLGSLGEGVVVADPNGRFLYFNDAARAMVGQGPVEAPPSEWSSAYGCYLADSTTPFPVDRLPLARAIRGEKCSDELMFIRRPDLPEGIWINISGSPVLDGENRVIGGVIVMRDVTARKKAEEMSERLLSAVEHTADVVFITGRDGRIQYVNRAFESVFGFARAEAVGQTPRIIKSGIHDREYYQALWQTILSGKVHRATTINRKKTGEIVHAEQTITPLLNEQGKVTHFVSVLKDMTEKRKREAQEAELRLAAQVQANLYPGRAPTVRGLDIAGVVLPASATCGDYFDYIRLRDRSIVIAVGDVTGHGLGPALLMAGTRAYLRSSLQHSDDLAQVLENLNQNLVMDVDSGRFVTLLLVRISEGGRHLQYANAGQEPGCVCDSEGRLRAPLDVTGPALGISAEARYRTPSPLSLSPGDLVVLLTDGVTEIRAPDGSFFGESRLFEILRECRDESAAGIVQRLAQASMEFSRGVDPQDDRTIVVARIRPAVDPAKG